MYSLSASPHAMVVLMPITGCRPPPPHLHVVTAGINHLNEEITPPPPHWDRRAILPNHIKFRTCSALALI
jgi:hypothetical protein